MIQTSKNKCECMEIGKNGAARKENNKSTWYRREPSVGLDEADTGRSLHRHLCRTTSHMPRYAEEECPAGRVNNEVETKMT